MTLGTRRHAAVFKGLLSLKKPGEYTCLRISDDPLGSGRYTVAAVRPTVSWIVGFLSPIFRKAARDW